MMLVQPRSACPAVQNALPLGTLRICISPPDWMCMPDIDHVLDDIHRVAHMPS